MVNEVVQTLQKTLESLEELAPVNCHPELVRHAIGCLRDLIEDLRNAKEPSIAIDLAHTAGTQR